MSEAREAADKILNVVEHAVTNLTGRTTAVAEHDRVIATGVVQAAIDRATARLRKRVEELEGGRWELITLGGADDAND